MYPSTWVSEVVGYDLTQVLGSQRVVGYDLTQVLGSQRVVGYDLTQVLGSEGSWVLFFRLWCYTIHFEGDFALYKA